MAWSRAVGVAALWSVAGAAAGTLLAGLIDMDGYHPDLGVFAGTTLFAAFLFTMAAHGTHRSTRITVLVIVLTFLFALFCLALFGVLALLRIGA